MMKKLLTLFIYIIAASSSWAQTFSAVGAQFLGAESPKREVRAMWLTTIGGLDWPHSYANNTARTIEKQQKELTDILDKLQAAGINTVLLQTRVRATTIYPSAYEPWDGCLSGKPGVSPGYDALQFAIEECHKRGMELHAWVVTMPVGKWNGKGCAALRKKYPKLVRKLGEDGYMNPEDPLTGTYIANICEEITRNYDVDGIHLDYIRYPEDWKITVAHDKGRKYITDIVRKINLKVKVLKPWVKMSCSPIGKYSDLPRQWSHGWNAYERVCQDAQGWLRDGLMDELFPMMYFKDQNFYPFAIDWQERSSGKIVVPGLGIYFMSPKEKNWSLTDITREMEVCRQWGMGHCYFRSKFFTDNTKGIYDFAAKQFDAYPALVPAATWESSKHPLPPTVLKTDSVHNTMEWSGAKDLSNGPYLTYNVYCSDEYPVDITKGSNLVVVRTQKTSVKVPLLGQYYAVTAMDRYGNESEPIQNCSLPTRHFTVSHVLQPSFENGIVELGEVSGGIGGTLLPLFPCDGKIVSIGRTELNNSDLLSIETMQGQCVKTTFLHQHIDVSDLPEGFYQIRSLGKKKSAHIIGYMMLERREWR